MVGKMTLSSRPQSVDDLKIIMQNKLNLAYDFTLQYEDPDFDGQLSCLVDIEELPEKAVLKVIRSESDASSTGTGDTEILPHARESPELETQRYCPMPESLQNWRHRDTAPRQRVSRTGDTEILPHARESPDRLENWPDGFPVPSFSYDIEHMLREGNTHYEKTGKTIKITRTHKHDVLEDIAKAVHSFKAYPSGGEMGKAADVLVTKQPCLKEAGSRSGWCAWMTSLKFKMGNYRTKLSRAGVPEVSLNAGKRSRNNPLKHQETQTS
ncbi:uncharacterized protein LOC123486584 [Coregonus clupeaformis]|uniref:uncharacterized protein LOC123486584 n=1 Tax=Coregonus clupeaformis TaxID=59861 RepID=UPI001E1C4FA4|nr:uncharacterized protein LOC123486584 [Coregonus clupeaformis]